MESLTKQQIVLLTLFVSFVTSMATGIFTVSLMDQAPQGVTQTINRVVEHTIERVVPSQAPAAVIKAPIVTFEDVSAKATEIALKSVVRIVRSVEGAGEITEGYGVVMTKEGKIATDKSVTIVPGTYYIIFSDGSRYQATVISSTQGSGISFLTPILTQADQARSQFVPATFAPTTNLKLGQTLLLVGGEKSLSVYQGIIQALTKGDNPNPQPFTVAPSPAVSGSIKSISFSAGNAQTLMGSLLFNILGELVGIKTQTVASESANEFLPTELFMQAAK